MAIEDLFKIVKERFVAEQPAVPASQEGDVEYTTASSQPR